MKPRERVISAMEHQEPDDYVPVWEIEFQLYNKFSRRPLIMAEEYTKLTAAEKDRALHVNAEIMIEVAGELGLSALSNIGPYWEIAPGHPAYIWLPPEDSDRMVPVLRKVAGDEFFIIQWVSPVVFIPEADKYVDFAYQLFDAPEEVDALADEKLAAALEVSRKARDAGADGLNAACDIADNKGMYFNPEQLDRFLIPYLTQWARAVKEMGMKSIYHTDGDITSVLEKFAGTDLDAIQAIDPVAGMDIVKVKKQVGDRLCLCGNIDVGLLLNGPIEAIRAEVKWICESCKAGGGFMLGASNAVVKEIPAEHYRALLEAGREFGNYQN